jgi:hypothetical protein
VSRRRLILLRRILIVLAGLVLAWAVAAARTGGFIVELSAFRLSSRNPRNVLIIAVLMAAAAWRLSTSGRAGPLAEEWAWWRLTWPAILTRISMSWKLDVGSYQVSAR